MSEHESGAAQQERQASVTLRAVSGQSDASLMDPANQSLAEALRLTFRILQLIMLGLVAAYFLTGFQSIQANERGVALLFGRVVASELPPGFRFAAPYPIGELVRVNTGVNAQPLNREYWPYTEMGREETTPIDRLRGLANISPVEDGSLITADGNLAHAQWEVQYRRANPTAYLRNVYTQNEVELVRGAVMRGIVQAVAEVTITGLLTQSGEGDGSVETRARTIAQQALDLLDTGIEIERLALKRKIPPVFLRHHFANVQAAESKKGAASETAQREANQLLNETAGRAATSIISAIDEYEAALALGDNAAADTALARITRLLDGEAPPDHTGEALLSGEVSRIISEARQYRSSVVSRSRAELSLYKAKLAQYRTNPAVMVHSEWANAVRAFYQNDGLQTILSPRGLGHLEVVINQDPFAMQERERAERLQRNIEAMRQRQEEQRRERFRTHEGLAATPE
ncbi:MAG: hypothetical protein KIS87_05215 [Phycisphaeraceae bacterium]|nr:hypothetical protein [Phycisphaeraceae bacterium]